MAGPSLVKIFTKLAESNPDLTPLTKTGFTPKLTRQLTLLDDGFQEPICLQLGTFVPEDMHNSLSLPDS